MSTIEEYRVVWKNADGGQEDWITLDVDYRPLTLDQAIGFANGRVLHAEHLKNTDVRVEKRQVITTDWALERKWA